MGEGSAGRSVLDCIFTLLLLGILISMAAPIVSGILMARQLKRESSYLKSTLERLVLESRQGENDIELIINERSYVASGIVHRNLKHPVEIDIPTQDTHQIIKFFRTGAVSPQTIVVSNKLKTCVIKISLRGRVTETC